MSLTCAQIDIDAFVFLYLNMYTKFKLKETAGLIEINFITN